MLKTNFTKSLIQKAHFINREKINQTLRNSSACVYENQIYIYIKKQNKSYMSDSPV